MGALISGMGANWRHWGHSDLGRVQNRGTIFHLSYLVKDQTGDDVIAMYELSLISHYKEIGFNINVLQQTACLIVNPIMVGNFASTL